MQWIQQLIGLTGIDADAPAGSETGPDLFGINEAVVQANQFVGIPDTAFQKKPISVPEITLRIRHKPARLSGPILF